MIYGNFLENFMLRWKMEIHADETLKYCGFDSSAYLLYITTGINFEVTFTIANSITGVSSPTRPLEIQNQDTITRKYEKLLKKREIEGKLAILKHFFLFLLNLFLLHPTMPFSCY